MNSTLAHREIVSKHNTYDHVTNLGRVSARKVRGEYVVTIEQFGSRPQAPMHFKTLRGALIAFEGAKGLI
jgi:hypothetical protein